MTLAGPAGGSDVARLTAVIARQRRELDELRSRAAARAVVDLARGMLMEQLGCSPSEAREQLAHLSAEARTSITELAAQITGQPAAPDPPGQPAPQPREHPVSLAAEAAAAASGAPGIAAAILEEALAPVGSVAVALWVMEPDGWLELAGQAGFSPRDASRWRRIHPDMHGPVPRAARDGVESWWPAGNPVGGDTPLIGGWPGGARAVLPLRGSGQPPGAMEICWPGPLADFPPALRRQLGSLAEVCARAIGSEPAAASGAGDGDTTWLLGLLDALGDSVLVASAIRDDAGQVTDFRIDHLSDGFRDPAGRSAAELAGQSLLEAYPAAALAGGIYERGLQVLASGDPEHLPGEIITGQFPDVTVAPVLEVRIARLFDGVVITWRRADEAERLAAMLGHAQRLGRLGGWEENLLTGQVSWTEPTFALFGRQPGATVPLAELHTRVPEDDLPALQRFRDTLVREVKEAAAVFRVIRDNDASIRQVRAFAEPVTSPAGHLVAVRGAYQDVSADYHTQVAFAAARDQLADAEERAEEDRRLALRLQQAITPRSAQPVSVTGLDVVTRYRPSGPGTLVSGDWYDTALLPGKDVLLVVGDIAGHGLDAVTGMVTMRNCLRGLAVTGAGPARLLGWLNGVACLLADDIIATAVCGLYNPVSRALRWSSAGHLPPVLVRDGQARPLRLPQGLLLGADPGARYRGMRTQLRAGDTLLLFTDGLIERRQQPIDDALESLLAAASRPVADLAQYADHLLAHAAADTGDDACLLVVHVR
jgi:serine phosphatase RsbU (regulator of sigma subunit)